MADPIQNTQQVSEGLARLLSQFRGKPNITAVLQSYLIQVQEIEDMFFELLIGIPAGIFWYLPVDPLY